MWLATNISFADNVTLHTVTQNQTLSVDQIKQTFNTNVTSFVENLNLSNAHVFDVHVDDEPVSYMTYVLFCLVCIVTVLGLFGNTLTLAVIRRLNTSQLKGHDILISALAVFDGIAQIPLALTHLYVHAVIGRDIRAFTTVGCKIFMCIWQLAMVCSYSVVLLICVERFVAVWYPLKAKVMISRKYVTRCLLSSVMVMVVVYTPPAILYSEIEDGICIPNLGGEVHSSVLNTQPNTQVYVTIMMAHMVSYLATLLTLTPMIIGKLYKQRIVRRQLTAADQGNDFRVSVKLIAVVVAFLLLVVVPFGVSFIFGLVGTNTIDAGQTILSVLLLTIQLNHTINFLIYNVVDAEFRRNALRILGCKP